ncbi:MAG: tetratricopeptide repeat protein [Aquabacterium sp.]
MEFAVPSIRPRLTRLAAQCLTIAALSFTALSVQADDIADVQKLLAAGRNAEALQKADQFLVAKPRDPMMRFLRGISLSQSGRTAEAINVFTKLTEDFPELPEPFNNLAVLYAQQGQYDKARNALEMAIRTNPSYATAYENLGDVYAKLASQAYSKALQIDTRSAVAPKLAMIRELFPKERNSITAVAAATPAATPAATTPAARPSPAAAPAPAPAPAPTPAPAATPAPRPTPAPTPAPAPAPAATPAAPAQTTPAASAAAREEAQERQVEAAVAAWAKAWSDRDMKDYYAAYTRNFRGDKDSRKAWEDERRQRIVSKRSIEVRVVNPRIEINGDKAIVRFRQEYRADSLSVNSNKRLELVRSGNKWLIEKETTGS